MLLPTTAERDVVARNPFAVTFLPAEPDDDTESMLHCINLYSEGVHLFGRELFIYSPDGMERSKLTPVLERILGKSGAFRNFNIVTELLEMAEKLEIKRR